MTRTIFLRVGQKDRVSLAEFISSLQNFLGILRDLDATISKDQRGSVIWEVVSLQQNSPPIVGVSPTLRSSEIQDFSSVVESQVLENVKLLGLGTEPTAFMSYAALKKLEGLASRTKSIGSMSVFLNGDVDKQESNITEKTLSNVRELTGVKYSGYGSITGKLEAISVHKNSEFRVWDDKTNKPVRCKYEPAGLEDRIKSLLRSRVMVSGMIQSNTAGIPIALEVENIDAARQHAIPTIREMSGSIKGITEGKSLKEYLDQINDDY
jgi:hypothetical protein